MAAIIHLCSDSYRHDFLHNNGISRGSVPNFYHWKLQHDDFDEGKTWHSRVRPYVGDCITVEGQPYQVISLELYDEGSFLDGIIHLKET